MADVITTLHPEGAPEDDLYPNIKKENLPSKLQPVADFTLSEYEKTLNLWDERWESGYYDVSGLPAPGTNVRSGSANPIKVSPNSSIFLGYSGTTANVAFNITYYDANEAFVSQLGWTNANRSITIPANCHYIKFFMNGAYGTTYNHDITITEGIQSVGYHSYNGKVMHEIDCEGVLLWKNAFPNVSFSPNAVSIPSLPEYKRLLFAFKLNNDNNYATQTLLVFKEIGKYVFLACVGSGGDRWVRTAFVETSTTIRFMEGKTDGTENNNSCIPVAIYGIK